LFFADCCKVGVDLRRMADGKKIRASIRERQAAPVPLLVAASLVHFQLSGIGARSEGELDRALEEAAMSLAQIADVYYENDKAHVLRIPDEDLLGGTFRDGGKTFAAASGRVYSGLSMRRIDVMYAVEVLEKARRTLSALATAKGREDIS
jgi:hypothetical protein